MTTASESNHRSIFLKLLETELNRIIVPAATDDVSRRTAALAALQLSRLRIDETVLPQLCRDALGTYRRLLPELHACLDAALYQRLNTALQDGDVAHWSTLERVLGEVMHALLARDDAAARVLSGKMIAIDAHIRSSKEQAWLTRDKTLPPKEASAGGAGLNEAEQARLLDFLKRRFPNERDLRIAAVKPLTGGFSKQTLFIDLAGNVELPAGLVMRRDAAYFTTGSSVTMEYPLLVSMYAAGVKVPQPFAVDDTGEVLGTAFMLVARVQGSILGDFLTVAAPSREAALNLARQVASIHAAPLAGLEQVLEGGTESVCARLLAEIQKHEAMWHSVTNHQSYAVQTALEWLQRNIHLADGPRSIVHRDVGVHNMLIHDNDVAAFLDWETAVVGTPAEDVAYVYYQVAQMCDWDEFLAAYEEAAGVRFDRRQLDYYMLWASVRIAVGIYCMVDPVFSGQRINLPEYYLGDCYGQTLIQRIADKLAQVLA